MVRTKADAATRVAAGGKAPKKSINYARNSPSTSPTEKGKDNLPVNRYFPRETPGWQKKITFFYERHIALSDSSELTKEIKVYKQHNKNPKRSSSDFDEETDMEANGNESCLKKIKTSNNMEIYFKQTTNLKYSKEINEKESMEMDK